MGFGVNKIKGSYKNKLYIFLYSIYYVFAFFMFVLAPTSFHGILPELNQIIISWSILSITILIGIMWFSTFNTGHLIFVLAIFAYLTVITIISNYYDANGRFSLARIAPIVCFLLFTLLNFKINISIRLTKFFVHFFMIIFIIWNYLIIVGNSFIENYTISNYTQLYQEATSNMFIKKRPIMSFGIYTFASLFYFLFFFINKSFWEITRKKIYMIYMILLLVVNVLLVSNTAAIFSLIMAYYIYRSIKKPFFKVLMVILIIISVFLLFANFNLSEYYLESLNSESNGFRGRYTDYGTLNTNLEYIDNYFFIGFNIIDGLTYSDSGYIVYYTMGGILLIITMYFCLYKFLKHNIPNNYLYILIPILIFEIALPVIIYYKFIYASIFFIITMKAIENYRINKSC
ncbi:oligosaccharide repeat unit polymerase [Chryseobacterium indoltheticum]|uniref:oligosaccharide repeat unit polymerase n=1 Tax=Chryseobacterium indoltheticum TaxID=254 RepID=UPI001912F905|nr:oligosaccharide repeat unit polymerase [Chryseobacterium indoltheticum]QQQ28047.1 oligosaccharide repeat unit polymerase [Chryseobacterium indoltheticum]